MNAIFPILIAVNIVMIPIGIGLGIYFLTKKEHATTTEPNNHNYSENNHSTNVKYAGFWKRFLAYILDGLVLIIPMVIISLLLKDFAVLVTLPLGWLYYALLESSEKQATVGKMALGIKVTDNHGKRLTFARATGRHFAKILSGITLCIGYIMAGFTEKKQGLHDIIANTLVVNNDPKHS